MDYVVTLENVSEGRFTARTIQRMYELIDEARVDPYIQNMARAIVRDCPHKDYTCFGNCLLQRAKEVVAYVPDPKGIERLQDPWTTLMIGTGDCDDYSILLNSWGASVGMQDALATVKASTDPKTGKISERWSHVLSVLKPPGADKWMGADGIVPESFFGWMPNGYEVKVWPR